MAYIFVTFDILILVCDEQEIMEFTICSRLNFK